jgi:hypothetical protein
MRNKGLKNKKLKSVVFNSVASSFRYVWISNSYSIKESILDRIRYSVGDFVWYPVSDFITDYIKQTVFSNITKGVQKLNR